MLFSLWSWSGFLPLGKGTELVKGNSSMPREVGFHASVVFKCAMGVITLSLSHPLSFYFYFCHCMIFSFGCCHHSGPTLFQFFYPSINPSNKLFPSTSVPQWLCLSLRLLFTPLSLSLSFCLTFDQLNISFNVFCISYHSFQYFWLSFCKWHRVQFVNSLPQDSHNCLKLLLCRSPLCSLRQVFSFVICAYISIYKVYHLCPVWPNLANFRHFGKSLRVVGNFETVYLVFDKKFDNTLGNF